MINKKDYICASPFDNLEMHEKRSFLCCPSWVTKWLPEGLGAKESFNSQEAKEIRDSILDGSYRYCDDKQCPFLMSKNPSSTIISPLFLKKDLPDSIKQRIEAHKNNKEFSPRTIQFSFDRSCNLQCPSCRIGIITANSKKIQEVHKTIEEVEKDYGAEVRTLYITGSGDPFVSVAFRNFLRNFDKSKWPKLTTIHLHTNATKWDKKMWDSMKNIHPYVKTCEISIDAATKDTYENKTRIGGNWDELIDNLKFIATIPTLKYVKPSFVVQQKNYKEIKLFYDLMSDIFGNRANIFYGKINNWGTFTESEFNEAAVWKPEHPEHEQFVEEVNRALRSQRIWTNLKEFTTPKKTLL